MTPPTDSKVGTTLFSIIFLLINNITEKYCPVRSFHLNGQALGFSTIHLKVRAIRHESAIAGHGSRRITAYDVVYPLNYVLLCCSRRLIILQQDTAFIHGQ